MPFPPSIVYTRQRQRPFDERHLQSIAQMRKVMDWFGTPPICFDPRCRRAGRCAGDPRQGRFFLPPCVGHYREEFRFIVYGPGGLIETGTAEGWLGPDGQPTEEAKRAVRGRRRESILEWLYGSEPPIVERLRRSPHVPGPGGWEIDPEGFADYIVAGDWRNPHNVCRREEVRIGNRWVG